MTVKADSLARQEASGTTPPHHGALLNKRRIEELEGGKRNDSAACHALQAGAGFLREVLTCSV